MLIKTQFLQQPNTKLKHLSEQGFTLVESLIAMVVISVVIVAITPPIFLSVANRVQHRRTEQAIQLAQGEIDRVRVLAEQGDYKPGDLPAIATPDAPSGNATYDSKFEEIPPPTIPPGNKLKTDNSNCSTSVPPNPPYTVKQLPVNEVWRVDVDRDCKMDFLVQIFRDVGDATPTTTPMAFRMGVRVYAAVAAENMANLGIKPASLNLTTGIGNQRSRPLAVVYNKIARSDTPRSLSQYDKSLPTP